MILGMMDGAKWHCELIAHFEPKSARLRKANMVRLRRGPPTNQTGLLGNKTEMLLRAYPLWFADGEDALIDPSGQRRRKRVARLLGRIVCRSAASCR